MAALAAAALCLVLPAAAGAVVRTPSGWAVNPVGNQLLVSPGVAGFQGPLGTALSPDGRFALAASSGAARIQSADLFDLATGGRTGFVGYDGQLGESIFLGVALSPDGTPASASGGGENEVHDNGVQNGQRMQARDIASP